MNFDVSEQTKIPIKETKSYVFVCLQKLYVRYIYHISQLSCLSAVLENLPP